MALSIEMADIIWNNGCKTVNSYKAILFSLSGAYRHQHSVFHGNHWGSVKSRSSLQEKEVVPSLEGLQPCIYIVADSSGHWWVKIRTAMVNIYMPLSAHHSWPCGKLWKPRVVMIPNLSSLVAPQTTDSDDKVDNMTTLDFYYFIVPGKAAVGHNDSQRYHQ